MNVTSIAATFPGGSPRFDDPHYKLRPEEYEKYTPYAQTKTYANLFSIELANRYKNEGILAFGAHPGSESVHFLAGSALNFAFAVIPGTPLGQSLPVENLKAWGEQ